MDNPFTEDELSYLLQFPKSIASNAPMPYFTWNNQLLIKDKFNSKSIQTGEYKLMLQIFCKKFSFLKHFVWNNFSKLVYT